MSTVVKRKKELGYDFSWLGADLRTDEQGMTAWDLAVGCHEILVDASERVTAQQEWHMVLCMMNKASMMSLQGKHRAANGYLQRVMVKIESILEKVADINRIEPLRLAGLLHLHEENESKFENAMKEMVALRDRLSDHAEVKEKAREALHCLQLADSNRNSYFKTKRKDYSAPEIGFPDEENPAVADPTAQETEVDEDGTGSESEGK